ncbi:MAG TPA: DUF4129 domain-containing transglutaminase family protein [Usitatibacter sp.]|nr:DUF4129 domain-containing transglutaminase family protein [Usitatibacter sp.]
MNAPFGLVGAALALWGLSIRQPWLGIGAGLAFEALRLASPVGSAIVTRRATAVIRICMLLALAWLGYLMATEALPRSLYNWLRWLPAILLPIPALQVIAGRLPLSILARSLRPAKRTPAQDRDIDLTHAYAAITLAAAGTDTGTQAWLYAGFAIVVAWALLARMPARRRAAAGVLVAVAASLGYATQLGLSALQGQVEEWSTDFFADLMAGKPDPFRERTRIGDLGKVKLSDRIVMRVVVAAPRPDALLLREAAFDRYLGGEWQSARRAGRPAIREAQRWVLGPGAATGRLMLRRSLPGGEGLLPLPLGASFVDNLPAQSVEVFPSGTVRARGTPRFLSMDVGYDAQADRGAPDAVADLAVPEVLSATLGRVLAEERLARETPAATVDALRAFFDARFSYSLTLNRGGAGGRTLTDFLLREREGHCEYFATATVLLLRSAGIPARYVGGYSAQEYSALEQAFVVRARHAHAWAAAYVDGRWINVDTTPARWAEFEAQEARGFLAPILDRLSWLLDRAVQAWLGRSGDELTRIASLAFLLALAVPFVIVAARRLRARARARPASALDPVAAAWIALEATLARAGHARAPGETARAWAARLESEHPGQPWPARLRALGQGYYRARFDPLAGKERRAEFVRAARAWKPSP